MAVNLAELIYLSARQSKALVVVDYSLKSKIRTGATVCRFSCEDSIRSVVVVGVNGAIAGLVSDPIEVCASKDVVGWSATLCWRMVSISAGAEDGVFECTEGNSWAGTSSIFEASCKVSLAGAADGGCSVSIVARSSRLAAG